MADTHEEQLLSDLLRDIAREDARLDAARLEALVLESASLHASAAARRSKAWMLLPVVAAILAAVALSVRPKPQTTSAESAAPARTDATEVVASPPRQTVAARRSPVEPGRPNRVRREDAVREPIAESPVANVPVVSQPVAQSPVTDSPIEFVPLVPITEQELSGPFQIVRVQMPNAALGTLRSPLEHPNELVEADVLLGEDGRARAIRVNTNGSIYPWRPR